MQSTHRVRQLLSNATTHQQTCAYPALAVDTHTSTEFIIYVNDTYECEASRLAFRARIRKLVKK